jgi:hypothetical protein
MIETQTTIKELFASLGYDYLTMDVNKSIDVSHLGYEVKTSKKGELAWSLVKSIIRKESTDAYYVPQFDLSVSPLHLFFAKVDGSEPHWIEATALIDCNYVELYHESDGWVPCQVIWQQNRKIDILDIEVEETNSYFSNGVLSHNTMHGDPLTTPGGRAIPFHSSVRIRLGSGNQVKDKNGMPIGIHTTVTIKKNKVAPPFRKCEFDIIFGKGIVEDEYLFDECRSYCKENGPVKRKGHTINISGEGAWKELSVVAEKTGEVVVEKKFYKSEFGSLMKDAIHGPFIMEVIDVALTLTAGSAADPTEADDNISDDGGADE